MEMKTGTVATKLFPVVLKVAFIFLPTIVLFAICLQQGVSISDFSVAVNDEVGWYNQVFSTVRYGKPLGYWGYNGTHAELGTFGPWGAVIVYLMSFFMKLLSPFVDIVSFEGIFIVNNLLWACGANLIFLLLAKPNSRQLVKLVLVYGLLFVNHCYMFVGMSEIVRFSMGIILTGLMVYILNRRDTRAYRIMLYAVVPVGIILFTSAYVMFGLFIPVWFYCVYKNISSLRQYTFLWFLFGLAVTLVVSFILYCVNGWFSSPYITSVVSDLIAAFRSGIGAGCVHLMTAVAEKIKGCDLSFILSTRNEFGGFFCFYLPFFYGLCVYLAVTLLMHRTGKSVQDIELHVIALYLLTTFFGAFLVLYSTYYWTLVRGLNIAVTMGLYLLCMKQTDSDFKFIIPVMLLGVYPFLLVANNDFIEPRISKEPFEEYRTVFSTHIQISEGTDPWENTVACYGDVESASFMLPVGSAVNHMINCEPNVDARYVMIWKNALENVGATRDEIEAARKDMEKTHTVVYEDQELVLMINNKAE